MEAELEPTVEFLKGQLSLFVLDYPIANLEFGPVYALLPIELADLGRFELLGSMFDVGGFNMFEGESFTLSPYSDITLDNGSVSAFPLPGGPLMRLSAMMNVVFVRRKAMNALI